MAEPWIETTSIGLLVVAALGFIAGISGGLLGVGGSLILIPVLTFAYGPDQHLYQAAAMAVNVAVAVPSALRHHKAGATMPDMLRWMLPTAAIAVLAGVALSNLPVFEGQQGGIWLGRLLALFQIYVIALNIHRLRQPKTTQIEAISSRITPTKASATGGAMGLIAGLLGIGGGAVAVPMQQALLSIPLRNAIANSATVICLSATIGAVAKNATLSQHGLATTDGLLLAALLAPTAAIGGRLGAGLTHKLPIRQVRIALILILAVSAWRMAAL
ncbi:sulfite exporter TauE/SafE family protein [Mucisphaera sp.]|uniref:sulfite exporter TauE/SafE family protein n=1 Tax=Mucisphaera sp. TaxID=2913024 RepID=UPI003D103007